MEISRRTAIKALGAGLIGATASQMMPANAEAVPTVGKVPTLGKLQIKKLRVNKTIYSGTSKAILARGGLGHWIGSAKPGTTGQCVLFGHRTTAGGPMRRANLLNIGDAIIAAGVTYTVNRKDIVLAKDWRSTLQYGTSAKRLSIITCTKLNGTATSVKYRLIIHATA